MITLNTFPTHVAKTDNKVVANTYWKINSQGVYNGFITRFTRAIVINNMHNYINDEFSKQSLPKLTSVVQLILRFYIPINYSDIRRKKDGTISWKSPDLSYKPNYDEDNISWIWNKTIKDCLTKNNVWKDDSVEYCIGTDSKIIFINDIKDRKIEIDFKIC